MNSAETVLPMTEVKTSTPAAEAATSARRMTALRRGYVVVMSLILTILAGNWLASVAGQNMYEKDEARTDRQFVAPAPGLSPADLAAGQAVLTPGEAPATRSQLFYLGDSQVFSRPDAPPGALNSAQWLQILLARQDENAVRVRIGASPGMDISEMLLKALSASEENPRQDDVIVTDLALAEMRELGVRAEITSLVSSPAVNSELKSLISANPDLADADKTLEPLLTPQHASSNEAADQPLAERMEDTLQRKADTWSFFAQRENLVALGLLRYAQWEHRLLHITADKRIPTHAEPYRTNVQLLELLMRYARTRDMHLVFFFGPVRSIEPNPDDPEDLERMHRDVLRLCERYSVTCLDYSHVIPEGMWAEYSSHQRGAFALMAGQHDFYHYTEAAHQTLAEKIVSDAGSKILQWSNQPAGAH
jgi:hypothetical protein